MVLVHYDSIHLCNIHYQRKCRHPDNLWVLDGFWWLGNTVYGGNEWGVGRHGHMLGYQSRRCFWEDPGRTRWSSRLPKNIIREFQIYQSPAKPIGIIIDSPNSSPLKPKFPLSSDAEEHWNQLMDLWTCWTRGNRNSWFAPCRRIWDYESCESQIFRNQPT